MEKVNNMNLKELKKAFTTLINELEELSHYDIQYKLNEAKERLEEIKEEQQQCRETMRHNNSSCLFRETTSTEDMLFINASREDDQLEEEKLKIELFLAMGALLLKDEI